MYDVLLWCVHMMWWYELVMCMCSVSLCSIVCLLSYHSATSQRIHVLCYTYLAHSTHTLHSITFVRTAIRYHTLDPRIGANVQWRYTLAWWYDKRTVSLANIVTAQINTVSLTNTVLKETQHTLKQTQHKKIQHKKFLYNA